MNKWLDNYFSLSGFPDEEQRHRAVVILRVLGLSLAGAIVFGFTASLLSWGGMIPLASGVFAILVVLCLWLLHHGKLLLPSLLIPSMLLILVTFQTIDNHGAHDQAIMLYPCIICFAWLLLNRRTALIFLSLSLISIMLVIALEVNGVITPHVDGSSEYLDIITFIVALGSVAFVSDSVVNDLHTTITRLKSSERSLLQRTNELTQREAEIRMFIEEAPVGIAIMDSQRRIQLVNSRACEMTGFTEQELLGRDGAELISPEELERLPLMSNAELADRQLVREERLLTRKDGSTIWVLASVRVLPDKRLQYSVQDITDRKRIEQSLRESEEQYRTFIALSSEAIWRMDFDPPISTDISEDEQYSCILKSGILVDCNDVYARLYAYDSAEQIIGKRMDAVFPNLQKTDTAVLLEFIRSQYQLEDMETSGADNGYLQYFLSNIIGIVNDGKLIRAWGTVQDITKRKLAEVALQESEKRYRGAIISAGLVPYEIDYLDRRFTFIGDEIYKLTGYSPDEFTPQIMKTSVQEDYVWGPNANLPIDEARKLFIAGDLHEWRSDLRFLTRTGESRWISDASIEIKDDTGKVSGAIGIMQDITERKRIESERENLIVELERRNAELERFNYTLSHELKTPLVTIRGFLGYLEESVIKNNSIRIKSDITRIANAADKMHNMINELLELSRIGRVINPPKDVPFEEIVREGLHTVENRITERKVKIEIDPNLPQVYVDRHRLVEVMQNLLDNAIKYIGQQPEPVIRIGMRNEDTLQIFFVQDNGMGIDPIYQERIFGLFDKLDPLSEGTGIGLALVKRIITVHGGRVWVESEGLGKGSTFCFTLPNKA